MTEVSVRELKAHLPAYLRRAEAGERIVVTRRGKPIAHIAAEMEPSELDRKLAELEAQGVIRRGTGKLTGLNPPIKLRGKGPTVSEMMLEDRG